MLERADIRMTRPSKFLTFDISILDDLCGRMMKSLTLTSFGVGTTNEFAGGLRKGVSRDRVRGRQGLRGKITCGCSQDLGPS